ncbi:MAG: HEAT repeat domain-containing protein [Myxococcota bacterium]
MRRALVLFLLAAVPSLAFADDALRAQVLERLSGVEDPATEADLRALGAGVDVELFALAKDGTVPRSRRQSAVQALGWFPNEEHRAWLATLVGDPAGDRFLRRSACHALANGWGDAALPDLGKALADGDEQLRNQAARAIGRIGTPAAKSALEARLAVEPDGMVREAITASLGVPK